MGKPGEADSNRTKFSAFRASIRGRESQTRILTWVVAYNDQELWCGASNAFKQSSRSSKPEFADAWLNLGVAYEKQRRFEEEIEACLQAIKLKAGLGGRAL